MKQRTFSAFLRSGSHDSANDTWYTFQEEPAEIKLSMLGVASQKR